MPDQSPWQAALPSLHRCLRAAALGLLALGCLALLGGCAITRRIDSEVQSFVGAAKPVAGATYRFERLPSQTLGPEQAAFEAMAAQALAKVGLTLAATDPPRYSLQLGVQITRFQKAPPSGLRWGGVFSHGGDLGFGMRWMTPAEYWYRHSVQLVLRDLGSHQLAYETSAHFDGPWADSAQLLPVVLDAALQAYPQATPGPRTVVIELPPFATDSNH